MAILGHGTNTVATNYGSGYALDVMREHMEKVWILRSYIRVHQSGTRRQLKG